MSRETILKSIRYCLYALIVLVPLIYYPAGMYPFQVIKTAVFQSLVEVIAALYLALIIFNQEYRPRWTFLSVALFAFLFILSLSAVFAADWRLALFSDEQRTLGLIALLHFAVLYAVLAALKKEINWGTVWRVSITTAVAVACVGIAQTFLVFPKATSSQWLYILFEQPATRVGSTFSNSAFMAGYLLFNFFLALLLAFENAESKPPHPYGCGIDRYASRSTNDHSSTGLPALRRRLRQGERPWHPGCGGKSKSLSWIISALVIAAAIFLSQTIGVLLGFFAGLILLAIYFLAGKRFPSWLKKVSWGFLVLFVLLAGAGFITRANPFWQHIPGVSRVAAFSIDNLSVSTRLLTWQIALQGFKDWPILGWGFENFRIAYNAHYNPEMLTLGVAGTYWDKPHNVFLEYLTDTGILGFLAYLALLGAAFFVLFSRRKEFPPYTLPVFFALLAGYVVQNLVIFDTIGTYLMFFLALAFIDSRSSSDPQPEERKWGRLSLSHLAGGFLVLALVPIYFNFQMFNGSRLEYQGVNFFLNNLQEASLLSFNAALLTPTPYKDDVRKSFASTVAQAYEQGIEYPDLEALVPRLVGELKVVLKNHPQDFFNYLSLAQFENVFHSFGASYAAEAQLMAQKALELSPNRQQVYYVLAASSMARGDAQGAYDAFKEAVALNPAAGDPHFLFGLAAYGLRDIATGKIEIERAAALGRIPKSTAEAMTLGNFTADLLHDYSQAILDYKQAMAFTDSLTGAKQDNARQEILLKLGVASYYAGQKDAAKDYFLELQKKIDLTSLPIYPQLLPILRAVGVESLQ